MKTMELKQRVFGKYKNGSVKEVGLKITIRKGQILTMSTQGCV
jgi:hypothetical protein